MFIEFFFLFKCDVCFVNDKFVFVGAPTASSYQAKFVQVTILNEMYNHTCKHIYKATKYKYILCFFILCFAFLYFLLYVVHRTI